MDPYKILGVSPDTPEDDIKRAYRELARKYHPDNYAGSNLSDLAEERMKEINEAYDTIMSSRTGAKNTSAGAGYTGGGTQSANTQTYAQVRMAINQGHIQMAERMLEQIMQRDAEWYYLMGVIYARKGWYDEAASHYGRACQMDPSNAEYRAALSNLNLQGGYGGYRPMDEANLCDCCIQLAVCNCCLNCCCNGGL